MKDYKMVDEFIKKTMHFSVYQHKENTESSYYRITGSEILPRRLSIKDKEMTAVSKKGRNSANNFVGQLLGNFTSKEESPLKQHKPYGVRTQIWECPSRPLYVGYGTIGITGTSGKVKGDTGDLVVLYAPYKDKWDYICIFYFAGMGNVDGLEQAMEFLDKEALNVICEFVSHK